MIKTKQDDPFGMEQLRNKVIAVIGYGIQGRNQALCLRDSGCRVEIAARHGSPGFQQAKKDGFIPRTAAEAASRADVIELLTQDHVQAQVYRQEIQPQLAPGKALGFAHGFNIHFRQILPPTDIDVFLVAPKGPGDLVRKMFLEKKGVPCLIAVHQNATGQARHLALAYAQAIGGTRAGVIETTFQEETETDLFGEQAVLCGGVAELIQAGFDTLIKSGYQPAIAYFEVLHELKLITDLIQAHGISGMRRRVSATAAYGDLTRGNKIINQTTRKAMEKILRDIRTGVFAREWLRENKRHQVRFRKLLARADRHPLEKVGRKLRGMMPWLRESD